MQTIGSIQVLRCCAHKQHQYSCKRDETKREYCRELFIYNSKCGWDRAFYQFVNSIYIDCTFQLDSITFSLYFRTVLRSLSLSFSSASFSLCPSNAHSLAGTLAANIQFSYLGRIVMIFFFILFYFQGTHV